MKKICFPVVNNQGMDSDVYEHFGSAPHFIVVDTETNTVETLNNMDLNHQHGMCNPIKALGSNVVDAVVVGGIGAGALRGLQTKGIKVFKASSKTVKDNLEILRQGKLSELSSNEVCAGHSHLQIHQKDHNCCSTGNK